MTRFKPTKAESQRRIEEVTRLHAAGLTDPMISKAAGIPRATVGDIRRRLKLPANPTPEGEIVIPPRPEKTVVVASVPGERPPAYAPRLKPKEVLDRTRRITDLVAMLAAGGLSQEAKEAVARQVHGISNSFGDTRS